MKRESIIVLIVFISILWAEFSESQLITHKLDITGWDKINIEKLTPEIAKDYWSNNAGNAQLMGGSFLIYNKYDNKIYCTDGFNQRIVVFDEDLNFVCEFGKFGQGPGEINGPIGIAFNRDGRYVIANMNNRRLDIFNKNDNFLYSINLLNTDLMVYPRTDDKGRIYYSSLPDSCLISISNFDNNYRGKIGKPTNIGFDGYGFELENMIYFQVDNKGDIYCSFRHLPFIRKYDSSWKLVYEYDYSNIPGIKEIIIEHKKKNPEHLKTSWSAKCLCTGFDVDDRYIYIFFGYEGAISNRYYHNNEKCFYVLDKDNLNLVKKLAFYIEGKKVSFHGYDFTSDEFIYVINSPRTLCKYKK